MMRGNPETSFPADYRQARRSFIAAATAAGLDAIGRVHPARGPDGKPLFLDSVAQGPRDAKKALLLIAQGAAGSALQARLLHDTIALPPDTRLVLVHALDPARFAGLPSTDAQWPLVMLRAVATEDLAKVRQLCVADLDGQADSVEPALAAVLPGAKITVLAAQGDETARLVQIAAWLAGL